MMMNMPAEVLERGYTWHTEPPEVYGSCAEHPYADVVVVLGRTRGDTEDDQQWLYNDPLCVECGNTPFTFAWLTPSDG